MERGHPRRRAPFGIPYRHPELIPPLKFWPHPQSCAVSTHRPMKARELASSAERLSSRATPTNTTCHAAELHVRPRSCRAFARCGPPRVELSTRQPKHYPRVEDPSIRFYLGKSLNLIVPPLSDYRRQLQLLLLNY